MILEAIFGDFFGSMLGLGSFDEPPDTVPLSILGLPELPTDESELRRAFVRKVRELHPDLNPLDEASWAGVHGDEWEAVQWARSVLTRKLQDAAPVTGESGSVGHHTICNGCPECGHALGWRTGHPAYYGGYHTGAPDRVRFRGYCWPCVQEVRLREVREARLRARQHRTCEACGTVFTPSRADGRYCLSRCRQRAYRARARLAGEVQAA